MLLGKWNKSVIITYIGVICAVTGFLLVYLNKENYAVCCLMIAGICDLFDGFYARRCKRDEEEKEFGVQLDSLADVTNFIALPIAIFIGAGLTHPLFIILFAFFAICGVARLAYFNISTIAMKEQRESYEGLPVTYTALIVPFVMLLRFIIPEIAFIIIFSICIASIALLNILNIRVKKPRGAAYIFFSVLALIMLFVYAVIL